MLIVIVECRVKPERVEEFKRATRENAQNSLQEPGIARFDVLERADDPTRFALIEVYRTSDDPAKHKQTAHYQKWRIAVEEMMAEPRQSLKYSNLHPDDSGF